ncbi:MAG: hypothetical protein KGI45_03950 [Patescibacteria group bacterium]|nr:hypothetical protein [Patescibacteria group bacterium]MDE1941245.1 hypothetical protein [Patescibacteria group bacterium]MDE1967188.1 hypothetical protein [Patescibacteria group bacterium]
MKAYLKTEARVLRRRGYSLADLSSRLHISKSTASLWTKDVELSKLGKYRVEQKRVRDMKRGHDLLHRRKLGRLQSAETEALRLLNTLQDANRIRLIILAMIYQCEGSKNDIVVRFTNSDPSMIRLFVTMFRSVFKIDETKLKIRMHIHDYHDEKELKEFWSTTSMIPIERFSKSFRKFSNHTYEKIGYKGCVHVSYHDAHIARIILAVAKNVMGNYTEDAIPDSIDGRLV